MGTNIFQGNIHIFQNFLPIVTISDTEVGKRRKMLRTRILIKIQRSHLLTTLTNIRDKTGLQKIIK